MNIEGGGNSMHSQHSCQVHMTSPLTLLTLATLEDCGGWATGWASVEEEFSNAGASSPSDTLD